MSAQIPLALQLPHAPGLDDFVVGKNAALIDALTDHASGRGEAVMFIAGPHGSGRTHLLLGQCAAAENRGLRSAYVPLADAAVLDPALLDGLEHVDLIAVDDVHRISGDLRWETALFHLFNRSRERGTRQLFSAECGPTSLTLALADLRSRLAWGLTFAVQPLDDDGRLTLLRNLAARRALHLSDDVARYMLERGPRHPRELADAIARLDHASLAHQRRLTIPFVREQLDL